MRFLAGGLLTLAADYGTFAILFGWTPLFVASALSLAAGFVVSFIVNKVWVFGASGGSAQRRTRLQLVLYASLFLFNTLFTYVFILWAQGLGLNAYLAKLVTIMFILVWNFLLYRKFIFAVR